MKDLVNKFKALIKNPNICGYCIHLRRNKNYGRQFNIMSQIIKTSCLTERLFLHSAMSKLPLQEAEIGRNQYGVLYLKWISPCEELEALWVSVTSSEIVLSCAIAHSHITRVDYLRERLTKLKAKRRIVRDGIKKVSRFLDSQTAATITYDEHGKEHSFGWCSREDLASSLEYTREVFGEGMTKRAWVWSGEVKIA